MQENPRKVREIHSPHHISIRFHVPVHMSLCYCASSFTMLHFIHQTLSSPNQGYRLEEEAQVETNILRFACCSAPGPYAISPAVHSCIKVAYV